MLGMAVAAAGLDMIGNPCQPALLAVVIKYLPTGPIGFLAGVLAALSAPIFPSPQATWFDIYRP